MRADHCLAEIFWVYLSTRQQLEVEIIEFYHHIFRIKLSVARARNKWKYQGCVIKFSEGEEVQITAFEDLKLSLKDSILDGSVDDGPIHRH